MKHCRQLTGLNILYFYARHMLSAVKIWLLHTQMMMLSNIWQLYLRRELKTLFLLTNIWWEQSLKLTVFPMAKMFLSRVLWSILKEPVYIQVTQLLFTHHIILMIWCLKRFVMYRKSLHLNSARKVLSTFNILFITMNYM